MQVDILSAWLSKTQVYLPKATRQGKAVRPKNLEMLAELFDYKDKITIIEEIPRESVLPGLWIVPVFLGMPHRLKRRSGELAYYDALSADEIEAINHSPNGYVVADMALESLPASDAVFRTIHEGAREAGLRADKIVILNCNARSRSAYAAYCKRAGCTEAAHIIPFNYCMWALIGHNRTSEAFETRDLVLKQSEQTSLVRSKAFLSTNGRLRPHRAVACLYLSKEDLIDEGHVSLLGYSTEQFPDYQTELDRALDRYPRFAHLRSEIPRLVARMPMTLDTGKLDLKKDRSVITQDMPWKAPDPALYLGSYFSLVTETIFWERKTVAVTEKTFKPVMNMHPFIILGGRGSLAELRNMGFRTFAPYINEDYDQIEDYQQRVDIALQEAKRLCRLPTGQLHDLYNNLLPNLRHNFDLFWNGLFPQFADDVINAVQGQ